MYPRAIPKPSDCPASSDLVLTTPMASRNLGLRYANYESGARGKVDVKALLDMTVLELKKIALDKWPEGEECMSTSYCHTLIFDDVNLQHEWRFSDLN